MESISNLFSSKYTFRVPNYQREYAWGDSQIEDFWDDLNYLQPNRSHHTGTLTLEDVPEIQAQEIWGKDYALISRLGCKPYHIVDGQQRLTTVVILLCTMLEKYKSFGENVLVNGAFTLAQIKDKYLRWKNPNTGENHYFFDYGVQGASRDYLHKKIFRDPAFKDAPLTLTAYTQNLKRARNFFRKQLKPLKQKELDNLFAKLTLMMKFGVDSLESTYSAYEVFETMNNRGKPLSKLEILKNRLMYLAALLNNPSLQDKINDAWAKIYTQLGKNPERILNDDEFLRTHWEMFADTNRDNSNYLLDVKFSPNRLRSANFRTENSLATLTAPEIEKYIDSLRDAAEPWYNINFPDALSADESYWINRLNRLGTSYFKALILAMFMAPMERVELLREIENFLFVNAIARRRIDFRESHFSNEAHHLYTNAKSISVLTQEARNEFAYHKAHSVKMFVDSYERDHSFKDYISQYILQEYEWKADKNSAMFAAGSNRKTAVKFSLEHIYPQTPPIGGFTSFQSLPAQNQKIFLYSIGNLLWIPHKKNILLSNKNFAEKKQAYATGGVSEREVASIGDWTPDAVKNRSAKLLSFISEHWGLELTADQINKLLP